MALIETVPPEKAQGKLAELYAEVEQMFGSVPNNVRMLGVSPAILENQVQMVQYYVGHPALSMALLASIRMLVSKACNSNYCRNLNAGLLSTVGFTREDVAAMQEDPSKAPLPEKDKALLLFVLKAVDNPHSVGAEDMERLRALGWADVEIFDAVAHAARMVGTNIIFDTFKIDRDEVPFRRATE